MQLHCEYLQRGGEDQVVEWEAKLLETEYRLVRFIRSNRELLRYSLLRQAQKTIWNRELCRELWLALQQHKPEIIHVHNTFPLFSPAVFWTLGRWKRAQKRHKVRIVMTLHNFRLHCATATLMRPQKGKSAALCQRCFTRRPFLLRFWPAVRSRCFRSSLAMSLVMAVMLGLHNALRSWSRNVDCFIYINAAQKKLLTRVGFPKNKFVYKSNFLPPERISESRPKTAERQPLRLLFAGRLSGEKGIEILLDCLEPLENCPNMQRNIELRIAGDGPLQSKVQAWIAAHSRGSQPNLPNGPKCKVRYLGRLEKLDAQFAWAHFLLFPSIWYEGMPLILLESLCCGLPVIGFRLGAAAQMLFDCENSNKNSNIGGQRLGIGAEFFCDEAALHELNLRRSHSPKQLCQNFAAAIAEAAAINDAAYSAMCAAARSNFAQHYSAQQNLAMLRAIYEPN